MEITFLGTGTSHGVPMIACHCNVCTSDNPKNKRMRTSVLVCENDYNILIDATPEMRLQCIKNNITRLDAVLITHTHADHIFGLDDLRRFNIVQRKDIPIYGTSDTLEGIKRIFAYAFNVRTEKDGYLPRFSLNVINGNLKVGDLSIIPVDAIHGNGAVTGYRFERFAYITDVSEIPHHSLAKLMNLDVLVLGALRYRPHAKHFNIDQALDIVSKIRPKMTYFTHICHEIEHEATNDTLPENVELAYDGLNIKF
ncbi:MAG: MBL fold metallo-hydrolase [Candidatus Kuenenia sp.]|nr:MBL fold metallo-hydrolase [Candidatus Kuenenia hertensis]